MNISVVTHPTNQRLSNQELPTFSKTSCSSGICVKVAFPDGSSDLILAKEVVFQGTPTRVFKGRLVSTQAKAVIMRDEQDTSDQETIVFKSAKSLKCTKFRVDILKSGKATCLNHHPKVTDENARLMKTSLRKLNKEKSKTAKFQGLGKGS